MEKKGFFHLAKGFFIWHRVGSSTGALDDFLGHHEHTQCRRKRPGSEKRLSLRMQLVPSMHNAWIFLGKVRFQTNTFGFCLGFTLKFNGFPMRILGKTIIFYLKYNFSENKSRHWACLGPIASAMTNFFWARSLPTTLYMRMVSQKII